MRQCSNRRARAHSFLVALGFMAFAGVGNAVNVAFEPRLEVGALSIELEQNSFRGKGIINSGFKIESNMPFVGAGATLIMDQFLFDFYLQKAYSEIDVSTTEGNSIIFDKQLHSELDRDEYHISINHPVGDRGVLFGGYKKSKTGFSENTTRTGKPADNQSAAKGDTMRDIDFEQGGFFIGGSYMLTTGKHSTLTIDATLVDLDATLSSSGKDAISETGDTTGEKNLDYEYEGDAADLILGIMWRRNVGNNFSYSLGLSGYKHDFDVKESKVPDISESLMRYSLGVSYQY